MVGKVMNKKDIVKLVENIINDSTNKDFPLEESLDSSVESGLSSKVCKLI